MEVLANRSWNYGLGSRTSRISIQSCFDSVSRRLISHRVAGPPLTRQRLYQANFSRGLKSKSCEKDGEEKLHRRAIQASCITYRKKIVAARTLNHARYGKMAQPRKLSVCTYYLEKVADNKRR